MRLSVPSVVFAEASWYGSLRGGLHVGGGEDGQFFDGSSRWGVKGSAEASEGLTAVYRFEASVSTKDASQGGRLAYAGLSGGFGSISLGQIWNAAYNHVGVITDKSYYFGNAGTGYRHGNALSYAFSSGALGFQLDLISDSGEATGKAIDKTEFGVTIGLGEVGKVALAHTNQRDKMVEVMPTIQDWINTFEPNQPTTLNPGEENTPYDPGTDGMPAMYMVDDDGDEATAREPTPRKPVMQIDVKIAANHPQLDADGNLVAAHLDLIAKVATGYEIVTDEDNASTPCVETAGAANICVTKTAYVLRTSTPGTPETVTAGADGSRTVAAAGGETDVAYDYYLGTETNFHSTDATDGDPEVDGEPNVPTTVDQEGTAAGFGDPPQSTMEKKPGHKTTHVAVEFSVGGVTPYLGYSKKKMNGATQETKTTHYGLSGSLGDTGVGYLVAGRSIKDTDGMKTSPWLVNVWKDLGGGATVIFGHGNDDNGKSGKSRVGLHVGF